MRKGVVAAIVLSNVLAFTAAWADDGALAIPDVVSVIALDANGDVMAEAYPGLSNEWSLFDLGDPLNLETGWPLSYGWDEPEGVCPEGVSVAVVFYQVLIRRKDAKTSCPYPVHPSKVLFIAKMDDGTLAILRMQEGSKPASVKARYLDKEYDMYPATAEEVARIQTAGIEPDIDWSTANLESKISRQDNKSLVAYLDKANQAEMLGQAADLMAEILELYYTRNGTYPRTMCQLYTGPQAVITAIPRNPYAWERNLCDTEDGPPRPRGCVKYISERVNGGTQGEASTGYWLAITGDGPEVKPTRELPKSASRPFRVIRWIEQHHDPAS